jgi:hypothetical protein
MMHRQVLLCKGIFNVLFLPVQMSELNCFRLRCSYCRKGASFVDVDYSISITLDISLCTLCIYLCPAMSFSHHVAVIREVFKLQTACYIATTLKLITDVLIYVL